MTLAFRRRIQILLLTYLKCNMAAKRIYFSEKRKPSDFHRIFSLPNSKTAGKSVNGRPGSFGACAPISDYVELLNIESLSSFLSPGGAIVGGLYYTFDDNKLWSR